MRPLKGEDNGVADEKPVNIFVMGENVWRHDDTIDLVGRHLRHWSGNTANAFIIATHNPGATVG